MRGKQEEIETQIEILEEKCRELAPWKEKGL